MWCSQLSLHFSYLRGRWNFLDSRGSFATLGIESELGNAAPMVCARLHTIIEERKNLPHISFLNLAWEPSDSRRHLYSCGFERDEDAPEVHTQWVKHKTSHFSYRSTLL